MDEPPGGPPEEPPEPPERRFPEEPWTPGELLPPAEEPHPHGEFVEHETEETGVPDEIGELGAPEEGEPAGELEETQMHLLDEEEPAEGAPAEGAYHALEETDYLALEEEVHSPAELRERRAAERAARRRVGRQRLAVLLVAVVALVVIIVIATNGGSGKPTPPPPSTGPSLSAAITGKGYLAAGSSSSALPGNILVADENNHRLLLLSPEGQLGWSYPRLNGPSDAYPSATNRSIAVTEHSNFQVLVLGVSRRSIDYHYGHSGVPGSGVDRLHDPGTAQRLANGQLVIADKSNCRILFVVPPSHHPVLTLGRPHACRHDPPTRFSYPDAVFPTSDGGLVVTEFTPAWIDVLSAHHTLLDEIRVSGLSAPYDANQVSGDEYIATNHAHPGAVEEFNTAGKVLWSYDVASGPGELYDPTLAEALPDGNVLVSDSRNDRVIVIDRATKKIIWQYGHTGKGTGAYGFLHTPDSAVLIR